MIAVMIAAAMCAVPLFIIEDSEAATITTGDKEKAVSFKAGSVEDAKFNELVSGPFKEYIASQVLTSIVPSDGDWAISEVVIKNVKDIKMSKGNSVSDSVIKEIDASAITCDITFKATCDNPYGTTLFEPYDGTQTLYKELGTYMVANGDVITIEGTATIEQYESIESSIVKNSDNNYVVKEINGKESQSSSFKGKVKVVSLDKTYELETKAENGTDVKVTPDYYNAEKIEDVKDTSKVVLTYSFGSDLVNYVFKYTINGKSDGYDKKLPSNAFMPFDYMAGTVSEIELMTTGEIILIYTGEIAPTPVYYYKAGTGMPTDSFFNDSTIALASPTNESVKTFLDGIGDVSDEFSTASSVADGAYTPVNKDGGSNNNIVFYVIIGVLAVAVVALAVLMIKKK